MYIYIYNNICIYNIRMRSHKVPLSFSRRALDKHQERGGGGGGGGKLT